MARKIFGKYFLSEFMSTQVFTVFVYNLAKVRRILA